MRHAAFVLLLLASPVFAQDKAIDWGALAAADIEAAYTITQREHPGVYDKANPDFAKLLSKARSEALKLAHKTTTPAGFEASLSRFKTVLNDGHAGAYASLPDKFQPEVTWPGFVAAWRGNAMYVYKSANGGPPDGAQILSCDKVPIRTLVNRNVFAYRTGFDVPGEWWSSARRVFVGTGNPFVTLPSNCRFRHNGKFFEKQLTWEPVPDYYQEWKNGSANGDLLPIGLTERASGMYWFALPDFQPDDAGIAAFQKMYADMLALRPKLLSARAIVLDLRFNSGGSSLWSKTLAQNLWGKSRTDQALTDYSINTRIWWRPTKDNLTILKAYVPELQKQGDPEALNFIKRLLPLFERAVAQNDTYLVEPEDPANPPESAADGTIELKTPVYVIVPGQCASACLNAVDYFKQFPNTKLIGAPSSMDSTYMDVRSANLPSGMGSAILPMKLYVNRPRGNGVFYTPDILVTDLDWSTDNFRKQIEADLKR